MMMLRLPALFLTTLLLATPAYAAEGLDKADTAWMMISCVLVLMMSLPGLALFYGGLVRKDNVLATLMQTFAVAVVISLIWPMFSYSFVFTEGNRWIGTSSKLFLEGVTADSLVGTIPESVFIFFQMTFAIITAAILLGSVADRIKFSAVMLFSVLWVVVVYTPVAHWVWGPGGSIGGAGDDAYAGLFGMGKALDFAGGTVVHITSGVAGLVAALVLGKSRYSNESTSNNLVLSVMGASLLWVGWFGFNAGSALSSGTQAGMAMLVTNGSAAIAALTWMLLEWRLQGKPSVGGAISGVVAGLVAITPGAGFVTFGGALVMGFVGSACCYAAVAILKEKLGFDDTLDAFGIHGVGGVIGAVLTGVFASSSIGGASGLLEGNTTQLWAQIISVLVVAAYTAFFTFVLLKFVQLAMGLRVTLEIEAEGLDLALHGNKVHVYK
jgi:Amt family ammonium transporter